MFDMVIPAQNTPQDTRSKKKTKKDSTSGTRKKRFSLSNKRKPGVRKHKKLCTQDTSVKYFTECAVEENETPNDISEPDPTRHIRDVTQTEQCLRVDEVETVGSAPWCDEPGFQETGQPRNGPTTANELPTPPVVDMFSTASITKRAHRMTTCWCSGVRVHSSCIKKFDIDVFDGTRLCIFDGGVNGLCNSDCLSCVPCIVCHKIKDVDTHTSLQRDFPVGDNWLFREERVCPSCLASVGVDHGTHCDVCGCEYQTIMS